MNLIIIFQNRDGRLQSTKGYHHPLTLLGTATAVLNESQVYICYTKGWKVSKAHNSGLVILGKCTNGREEDVCFSSSTPLSTYSLSLSFVILVHEYYSSTTRSKKRHVGCKKMNCKLYSHLQGLRTPHQNPHRRCHETAKGLRSYKVQSPRRE